jgi:hypothetical protein
MFASGAIRNNWCCPSSSHILALWLWPTLTYTRKHTCLKEPCCRRQARLHKPVCTYIRLLQSRWVAASHGFGGKGGRRGARNVKKKQFPPQIPPQARFPQPPPRDPTARTHPKPTCTHHIYLNAREKGGMLAKRFECSRKGPISNPGFRALEQPLWDLL